MAVSIAGSVETPPLLALLADGEMRSEESLAREMGTTAAAVRDAAHALCELDIDVQVSAFRGYRLSDPVELLDAKRVLLGVSPNSSPQVRVLEVAFEVDSTNTRLLACTPPPPGMADVCIAERQHAGRGRHGRRWVAPFGSGITMSVAWCFGDSERVLPALSLSVGVAIAKALSRVGAAGIGLKWPNDVWFQDRKVGGVLVETRAEAGGSAHVVIGVGINVHLPPTALARIESAGVLVAAVADACGTPPSRNHIAGALLDELLSMLVQYERQGFQAFRHDWTSLDALRGRSVRLQSGETITTGIARGADVDGALLLDVDGHPRRFVSGEASLRLVKGD